MGRVQLMDTPVTAMVKMSEGVPGAVVVLSSLFAETPKIDPQSALGGLGVMLYLDDMGIYGSKIWILYKDICGQDIRSVVALIRAVQLGLLPERELKRAIMDSFKHTLDVPALVTKVEEELEEFQKAPVVN